LRNDKNISCPAGDFSHGNQFASLESDKSLTQENFNNINYYMTIKNNFDKVYTPKKAKTAEKILSKDCKPTINKKISEISHIGYNNNFGNISFITDTRFPTQHGLNNCQKETSHDQDKNKIVIFNNNDDRHHFNSRVTSETRQTLRNSDSAASEDKMAMDSQPLNMFDVMNQK